MIKEIKKAMELISPYIYKTKLLYTEKLSQLTGNNVYLKLENMQKSGSFKIRGALNKIFSLTDEQKKGGLIAASAGNHAQGLAFASSLLKIEATIIMPLTAPLAKISATKTLGGNVILYGNSFDEALEYAKKLQKKEGYTFIHPYDDEKIIEGQGTIALEIFEDLPNVDIIMAPIGGGGLIAGVASGIKELKSDVKVIGVQSSRAAAMMKAIKNNKYESCSTRHSIADGINVGAPGKLPFEIIKKKVDDILEVDENEIALTILFLLEECKQVTEGAGCASAAPLLNDKIHEQGKNIAVIISGGNIDITLLHDIIDCALLASGRRAVLKINIKNSPGNIASLLSIIAKAGANIIEFHQSRTRKKLEMDELGVTLTIDTRDKKHLNLLINNITSNGYIINQ